MKPKSSQRQPVWLTPEAITAAGRLSQVTGLTLHELVETALLGVDADELSRELVADDGPEGAAPDAPADPISATGGPLAPVIPIDRRPRRPGASARSRPPKTA